MALKMLEMTLETLVVTALLFTHIARCSQIPGDRTQLNKWFDRTISSRPSSIIEPSLAAAEAHPATVIKVMAGGGGDFKTITDAVKSVPDGNQKRVVISIGPGNYTEKISVPRTKPFITFYGDRSDPPVLVFGGTAAEYGTVDSATLIVESDYFNAFNLKVVNSAPMPDGVMKGAQAEALRISGNAASFHNCRFYGYQDTVCDDRGKHFFKDCFIEGTMDFIFGSGKSIYLNTEIHVVPGCPVAMITAHARTTDKEDTGFVFVHCNVTGGDPGKAYLGRTWFPSPRVVFAYSNLGDVVNGDGWSDDQQPKTDRAIYFGEYKNKGPGAKLKRPVPSAKNMSGDDVKPFINLAFVEGSKWLLPPPTVPSVEYFLRASPIVSLDF